MRPSRTPRSAAKRALPVTSVPLRIPRSSCSATGQPVAFVQHGLRDLDITAAPTQVAGEILAGFLLRCVGILLQQRLCGEDEPRSAIRALERRMVDVRLLDGVKL